MHMIMSETTSFSQFLITAIALFCFFSINVAATCHESEKKALLDFKQDLKDPSNRLSSWIENVDCCKWEGVVCGNRSGHVIQLRLQNTGRIISDGPMVYPYDAIKYAVDPMSALGGKVNHSLLHLKHLRYLDLSLNDFQRTPIPSFLGSLISLTYLNLSQAGFGGIIPHQLGNLSRLRTLSLNAMYRGGLQVDSLDWLAGLSNLEHLDLSVVNLSTASNWLQVINMIPSLVELRLATSKLAHISHLKDHNFSSLRVLDLSLNGFGPFMPRWIFGLDSLASLDLSMNNFEAPWPKGPWNLTSLKHLDLSRNDLIGSPPRELTNLKNLVSLNLEATGIGGPFPHGIWNCSSLKYLDLSYNNLNSFMPNKNGLISLDLSSNDLQGSIPSSIANVSNLQYLDLSSNNLNSSLPNELFTLDGLIVLVLRQNHFNGPIPNTIGNSTKLKYLDLSGNDFKSSMLKWLYNCTSLESLVLFDNQLQGAILNDIVQQGKFKNLRLLDLGKNALSGSIPVNLGRLSSLEYLLLKDNKLNGTLPESLGQLSKLENLDISHNLMEGIVTERQLDNLTHLRLFSASGNSLTLKISARWIPPSQFETLALGSWQLGPQFPTWLKSQKKIDYLDLSLTGISGAIPSWFWNLSMQFGYLNLAHNQLDGQISNIYGNQDFSDIDLSSNKFSGSLPQLISRATSSLDLSNNSFSGSISHFLCEAENEEQILEYLNLGENFLSGEIPDCWMNWPGIEVINLNNNNLTGVIPRSMMQLESLRSLHLRNNRLSGQIPLILKTIENQLWHG